MRSRVAAFLVLVLAGSVLVGCGDDDEEGGASTAFCDIARELSAGEDFPPAARMDRYVELAPDAIHDDAELAIDAIKEKKEEAYDDPEVVEAVSRIEKFEKQECGIDR